MYKQKIIQDTLSSPLELQCAKAIESDQFFSECLKPCSGLTVTSILKSELPTKLDTLATDEVDFYANNEVNKNLQ